MDAVQRIVVGVDGSLTSRRALAWALDEAHLRGARVEVVHVWHVPYLATSAFATVPVDVEALEDAARRVLDEIVDDALVGSRPPVDIERVVAVGSPAECLLRFAKDADLLVVGCRGLGGFAGLLLGSVSHQVVHHAPCPVAIVPPPD